LHITCNPFHRTDVPPHKKKLAYTNRSLIKGHLTSRKFFLSRPQTLSPGEREGIHIVQEAEWVPGSVWTGAENLTPHQDSIPGPSNPYRVVILTARKESEKRKRKRENSEIHSKVQYRTVVSNSTVFVQVFLSVVTIVGLHKTYAVLHIEAPQICASYKQAFHFIQGNEDKCSVSQPL